MVTSTRTNSRGRSPANSRGRSPAPSVPVVPAPAVPAPVVPSVLFIEDPYQGDINPGTDQGLKLYLNATKSVEDDQRIDINVSQAKAIRATLEELSNQFGWAQLVHNIQNDSGIRKSIFRDIKQLKVSNVQNQAKEYLAPSSINVPSPLAIENTQPNVNEAHKDLFYKRIRSKIIAKTIEGRITKASWTNLMTRKNLFAWRTPIGDDFYDGPTMLKMLMDDVNPDARVGVSDLKSSIRKARLPAFQHNVFNMLSNMKNNYDLIIEAGETHDDFIGDIFTALMSSTNSSFTRFVEHQKGKWDTGKDITHEKLILKANALHSNMVANKTWNIMDPKDATIAAMTTTIQDVKKELNVLKEAKSSSSNGRRNKTDKDEPNNHVDPIRTKYDGDEKIINGKKQWWCRKHKHPVFFPDGSYVSHPECDHDEWKRDKWAHYKKVNAQNEEQNTIKDASDKENVKVDQTLNLNEKMKAVMTTKYCFTEEQAQEFIKDIGSKDF